MPAAPFQTPSTQAEVEARVGLTRDQVMTASEVAELLHMPVSTVYHLARQGELPARRLDPPQYLETAKVFDMVLALPKIGRLKATKILNSCRVSPSKTFGGLSARQSAELAERLHRS